MIKRSALVLLILASCLPVLAQTTSYTISFPTLSGNVLYETLDAALDRVAMVQIRVNRASTNLPALDYYLLVNYISPGSSTVGERRAYYDNNLHNDSVHYLILPTYTSALEIDYVGAPPLATELPGSMRKSKTDDYIQLYIKIPKGVISSASHTSTVSLALYTGSQSAPGGTATPAAGGIFTISIAGNSSETFTISMKPTDFLDLGVINPSVGLAENSTATMEVFAPQYYSIAVKSINGSCLIHTESLDQKIPYRFKFGRQDEGTLNEIDLTSGLTILVNRANTKAEPHIYKLSFFIDPIDLGTSLLEGGDYRDSLFFTFTTP